MNEVKKIAYEQIDHKFSGQVTYFAKSVIEEVFEYCETFFNEHYLTEENIHEALDLILDLQLTLHWGKDDQTTHLYRCFNWQDNLLDPWCNDDFFLDSSRLEVIICGYLACKWFSSPTFEWYVINSYLRVAINNYREIVFYGSGSRRMSISRPKTFLEYCYSLIFKKGFNLLIGCLLYILPLFLINIVFEKDWIVTALLLFLGYLYFLISEVIGFIKSLWERKKRLSILFKMVDLKANISAKSWSPAKIMEQINAIDEKVNIPELSPLVSKMIKRDPDIFNSYFFR